LHEQNVGEAEAISIRDVLRRAAAAMANALLEQKAANLCRRLCGEWREHCPPPLLTYLEMQPSKKRLPIPGAVLLEFGLRVLHERYDTKEELFAEYEACRRVGEAEPDARFPLIALALPLKNDVAAMLNVLDPDFHERTVPGSVFAVLARYAKLLLDVAEEVARHESNRVM